MTDHHGRNSMITEFFAPKGGAGCSTVAAATALSLGRPVHLVARDDSDLPAILGIPTPRDGEAKVGPNVTLHLDPDPGYVAAVLHTEGGAVIVDSGRRPIGWDRYQAGLVSRLIGVTRNCYLHLRAAAAANVRPDGWVLVAEPGRALTEADAPLGGPILATVAVDAATARTLDAGLLAARLPRSLQRLDGLTAEAVEVS